MGRGKMKVLYRGMRFPSMSGLARQMYSQETA